MLNLGGFLFILNNLLSLWNLKRNKMKVKSIKGNWTNDDVDLLPTIKLRIGSKVNIETKLKVKGVSIAICWLKWGIMVSFGRVINI